MGSGRGMNQWQVRKNVALLRKYRGRQVVKPLFPGQFRLSRILETKQPAGRAVVPLAGVCTDYRFHRIVFVEDWGLKRYAMLVPYALEGISETCSICNLPVWRHNELRIAGRSVWRAISRLPRTRA